MGLGRTITKEQLLSKYSDTDIFNLYLPGVEVGQQILSPLREEKTPSFVLFQGDSEICFKDFGGVGGDCVQFVAKLYNLPYRQALVKIEQDLIKGEVTGTPQEYVATTRPEKKSEIVVLDEPLSKIHLSYLKSFGIRDHSNILNPKQVWWNGKEINLLKNKYPLVFAYVYWQGGLPYYKLYRPYAKGKYKWFLSNVKSTMLDYGIKPRKRVIICKSRKDSRVMNEFLPGEIIGFQAEGLNNFSDDLMQKIFDNTEGDVWLFLDNDKTGRETAQTLKERWPKLKLIFTPDEVLPLNDPAGVRQKYGAKAIRKILKINEIL